MGEPMGLEEIARLEAIARAATPGPWDYDRVENEGEYGAGPHTRGGFSSYAVKAEDGKTLFDTLNSDAAMVEEEHDEYGSSAWDSVGRVNAEYSAAFDPPTVLRLLAAATRGAGLRRELEVLALEMRNYPRLWGPDACGPTTLGNWADRIAALSQPTPALSPDAGVKAGKLDFGEKWRLIKNHQALFGSGLAQAKDAVESGWRPTPPPVPAEPAPQADPEALRRNGQECIEVADRMLADELPLDPEIVIAAMDYLKASARLAAPAADAEPAPQAEGVAGLAQELRNYHRIWGRPPVATINAWADRIDALSAPAADAGTRINVDVGPHIGASTNEPSLREMVRFYYSQHDLADFASLSDRYLAALTRAGGEKGVADV